MSPLKTYWFTFGLGHTERPSYTWIEAHDADSARAQMFLEYGARWAFQYDSAEAAGVKRFALEYIPFGSHEGFID